MNILFLTLIDITDIDASGIYQDLLREFSHKGYQVHIVSPAERRTRRPTHIIKRDNCTILKVRIPNIQKTNLVEKGIATFLLKSLYLRAIGQYFPDEHFDLVIYSTPPITFSGVVQYVKKKYAAKSYLLLKDIFPQNAVDLGIFSPGSLLHRFFKNKEASLYQCSDFIGCMSPANSSYILKHNPAIDSSKVVVCPNSISQGMTWVSAQEKIQIRNERQIPLRTRTFVYGGNLGRPQDIPFIIQCLRQNANKPDRYFVICGTGTEYPKLEQYTQAERPNNVLLLNGLPGEAYHKLCAACDVGLIFLDHRFTIPNFPSRLLSYMELNMPVLACTDTNTDMGQIICDNEFGWWCESNDATGFTKMVDAIVELPLEQIAQKGQCARTYLEENYTVEKCYEIIMKSIEGER